jgi:hypothetical protein
VAQGRSISELFETKIQNSDYKTTEIPLEVSEYFEETHALPPGPIRKK